MGKEILLRRFIVEAQQFEKKSTRVEEAGWRERGGRVVKLLRAGAHPLTQPSTDYTVLELEGIRGANGEGKGWYSSEPS